MERRSAIAVAGAVTGILIAGSVAGVAVINAAASSTSSDELPIIAASVVEPDSVQIIEPAPSADQTALPAIVVPQPVASAPQTITAEQARQVATEATPGVVLATSRIERGGYDSFAVQIQRADGSVVTGYVEAASGVVFDWVVDKKATAPASSYSEDDEHEDDEHKDDEHKDDKHEDDEYEDERDHDDD